MANRNQHVIARQTLELDVPSVAIAPGIQEAVAQRLRDSAMAAVERLFDKLCDASTVVRLQRVEIDLGDLTGVDWEEQFESRLVTQLGQSIRQASAEPIQSVTAPRSGHSRTFEQYNFYLQHGRFPWWVATTSASEYQDVLQQLDPFQWGALSQLLICQVQARRRLVNLVNDETLSTLLNRHCGLRELVPVLMQWCPLTPGSTQHSFWRSQFWLVVLELATGNDQATRGLAIMQRLLALRDSVVTTTPRHNAPDQPTSMLLPDPWQRWFKLAQDDRNAKKGAGLKQDLVTERKDDESKSAALATPKTSRQGSEQSPPIDIRSVSSGQRHSPDITTESQSISFLRDNTDSIQYTRESRQISYPRGSTDSIQTHPTTTTLRHGDTAVRKNEAIYLNGAGCIILHPFLEQLFRSNELLVARNFRDQAARERAVHLLARLTFGDEATPEYELLLPKLLCAMAWEDALLPVELTDAERAACDELLRAVLNHWQVLKSNSTTWMREQFFLRSAKLEKLDRHWRLTVDRHAQDVLLDRLPWGLGVVSLPWMKERIYVHWTQ